MASSLDSRRLMASVIWHEGDLGDNLLVVEEGQVRVTRFTADGQDAVLAVCEALTTLVELARSMAYHATQPRSRIGPW
jgi:CRP-like cAMP-binding protein